MFTASITPISLPLFPLAATSAKGVGSALRTFLWNQIVFDCTRRSGVRSTAPYALSGAAPQKTSSEDVLSLNTSVRDVFGLIQV